LLTCVLLQDLSRLGRDVNDSIIIDNSPASYSFHPEHAVPITSWFDDKKDSELLQLLPLLTELSTSSLLPSTLLK
jgi:carboxy-terminal domain RNA polymerase II polypeptide A small phosphatase